MNQHPPHLDPLLAKGYATIHRHPDGTQTVGLTKRTLHPAFIRDVYAETVRYLRSLESQRVGSAEPDVLRELGAMLARMPESELRTKLTRLLGGVQ